MSQWYIIDCDKDISSHALLSRTRVPLRHRWWADLWKCLFVYITWYHLTWSISGCVDAPSPGVDGLRPVTFNPISTSSTWRRGETKRPKGPWPFILIWRTVESGRESQLGHQDWTRYVATISHSPSPKFPSRQMCCWSSSPWYCCCLFDARWLSLSLAFASCICKQCFDVMMKSDVPWRFDE